MTDARKQKLLSLGQKLKIIHAVETNLDKKKSLIASEQGVPVTALYSILKNKAEYTDQATCGQTRMQGQKGAQMQSVDDALLQWFSKSRTENKPISGPVLRAKAEELAVTFGQKWICTSSWLQRWRKRHGIVLKCVSGERADVNEETTDCCVEDVLVPTLNISPSECYTVGDSVVTNRPPACPAFIASPSSSTVSDPKAGDTGAADEDGDGDTELEKETRPISARKVLTAADTIMFCLQAGSEQGKGVVVKVEPQSETEAEQYMSRNSMFDRTEDNQHVKTEKKDSDVEEQDMSHNSMTADQQGDDFWMTCDFKMEVIDDDDKDMLRWNNLEHHAQDIDQISDGIHPERPAVINSHSDIHPQCDVMSMVSMSTANLKTNMSRYTGSKSYKCTECEASFSFPSGLKRHFRRHTGEKPYKCTECEASFTDSGDLTKHMRIHTGVKPYKCTECEASFTQSGNLNTHMLRHTGVKPYKCTECEASFTKSGSLKIHMRIHTGVKPYKCTECEAAFTQSSSLNAHMRIHTGLKPYSCAECEATFSQLCNLNTHMRRHTGVKPYKCTECEASFTKSIYLKTHMRIHTGVKPYNCTKCEASFNRSSTLKTHLQRHTGDIHCQEQGDRTTTESL